ncbi:MULTISPECIES: hypothetical protein [unclassified Pseudomonas]|uniref:hypothetical protein n=1 Tax=unclassified Pseudomonas TaxID=196821 RepID=UPI000D3D5B27|nr:MULTISPECIES: hypothetical protein [unclassified Pseudomonas]RAU45453.1 hypothetical protein DBP26_013560 [Pseudomonas sp. RIT 409]RAU53163.1 hypothetical protein DBY65_016185 [Pseudomonas sp. RIT 412]
MKTLIALLFVSVLAAISASALAMPCANKVRSSDETLDSRHLQRLHIALQHPMAVKLAGRVPAPAA